MSNNNKVAGSFVRLGATLIDLILGYLFVAIIYLIIEEMIGRPENLEQNTPFIPALFGTFIIFFVTIFLFIKLSWHSTPGKRFLGIQVVSEEGGCISTMQATLVSVFTLLEFILLFPVFEPLVNHSEIVFLFGSLLLFVSYMTMFFTNNNRTLQDILCGTWVMYREYKESEMHNIEQYGLQKIDDNKWIWKPKGFLIFNPAGKKYVINNHQKNRVFFYSSKFTVLPVFAILYCIGRAYSNEGAYSAGAPYLAVGIFLIIATTLYLLSGLIFIYSLIRNSKNAEELN